jgi:hypothetical protein
MNLIKTRYFAIRSVCFVGKFFSCHVFQSFLVLFVELVDVSKKRQLKKKKSKSKAEANDNDEAEDEEPATEPVTESTAIVPVAAVAAVPRPVETPSSKAEAASSSEPKRTTYEPQAANLAEIADVISQARTEVRFSVQYINVFRKFMVTLLSDVKRCQQVFCPQRNVGKTLSSIVQSLFVGSVQSSWCAVGRCYWSRYWLYSGCLSTISVLLCVRESAEPIESAEFDESMLEEKAPLDPKVALGAVKSAIRSAMAVYVESLTAEFDNADDEVCNFS